MTGKGMEKSRIVILLTVLLFAALACCTAALADDQEQMKYLPGVWMFSDEAEEEGEEPQAADLILTLEEDGGMTLCGKSGEGGDEYTYTGTWSSEFVPDAMDRLTLLFTSTDNPLYAGTEYSVKCVVNFYTESWVENDTWKIYLIIEENDFSGVSPFEDLCGCNNLALTREQGPNMRVVKCKDYVSLRSRPSVSSIRLAKVPLGALVLAVPGGKEENGFTWCTYHDEYGFILSEYLQLVE